MEYDSWDAKTLKAQAMLYVEEPLASAQQAFDKVSPQLVALRARAEKAMQGLKGSWEGPAAGAAGVAFDHTSAQAQTSADKVESASVLTRSARDTLGRKSAEAAGVQITEPSVWFAGDPLGKPASFAYDAKTTQADADRQKLLKIVKEMDNAGNLYTLFLPAFQPTTRIGEAPKQLPPLPGVRRGGGGSWAGMAGGGGFAGGSAGAGATGVPGAGAGAATSSSAGGSFAGGSSSAAIDQGRHLVPGQFSLAHLPDQVVDAASAGQHLSGAQVPAGGNVPGGMPPAGSPSGSGPGVWARGLGSGVVAGGAAAAGLGAWMVGEMGASAGSQPALGPGPQGGHRSGGSSLRDPHAAGKSAGRGVLGNGAAEGVTGRHAAAGQGESARPGSGQGMYPAGRAGGRHRDDDELPGRPEYLLEADEVWGDGRMVAPPVLGD